MRFASLGSGSRGNALLVEAGGTKLLVDCGFSLRSMVSRLARLSVSPEEITGILVTHEHSDHLAGVERFASRFEIPVYLTHGTRVAADGGSGFKPECLLVDSHSSLNIQTIQVLPFPVPHDAREPVQYLFDDGVSRLGVLTDCGTITPHIVDMLDGCDALVLECNHDRKMLADSAYPAMLKKRIAGEFGHLDNEQAASLLKTINSNRLKHVVAAHLSEQNNDPVLVKRVVAEALGCEERWVAVASQEEGFDWREL
jgi:phosphoribosyl 1,2-cyclic phosphodiesterase